MNFRKAITLFISHGFFAAAGFAAGIYTLPILIAPAAPTQSEIAVAASSAKYSGDFRRDLKGSDMLHWGEGSVAVGETTITLTGALAPGPDYKLYLSPEFVETEADFQRLKPAMALVGDIKTFENFVVKVPERVNISEYNTVIVWCETFGQFITSARYEQIR